MLARTHTIYIKTRIGRSGVNENISGDDLDILGGDFLRPTRTHRHRVRFEPEDGTVGVFGGAMFERAEKEVGGGFWIPAFVFFFKHMASDLKHSITAHCFF